MANTLFGMMNSGSTGLMGAQIGINITGNNIQNIKTPGYTRQRALFTSNRPVYYSNTGYLGTGVGVQDIQRLRDKHLDAQIRTETSSYNQYLSKQEILSDIEAIFGEPNEVGLNVDMDAFWDSLGELAKHPDNSTIHTLVKENSKVIADKLNSLSSQLDSISGEADIRQNHQEEVAADLISRINELNSVLAKSHQVDPNHTPNELLDERDLLTKQLSELMSIEVSINENFTVDVEVITSVGGTSKDALTMNKDDIRAIAGDLVSGSIKGYHDAKTSATDKYKANFNQFAESLATMVNNNQGYEFFQFDPANPAGSIVVNPDLINGTIDLNTGPNGSGDNSVILDLLKLRDEKVSIGGVNTTLNQFYKDVVASVGIEVQHANSSVKNQETVLTYLNNKFESLSGISEDEEMINLVQFQSAYDANAKFIQTVTQMLDTILNDMGV